MILDVPDVATYVETTEPRGSTGDADPRGTVVLLHGNPDSARLWDGVLGGLGDSRCVAPDLPGFGRSRARKSYVRKLRERPLETMAAWVDAVLAETVPEGPVHLVVHDFGGPYGLTWAVQHPERIASVAMIDTLYFSTYRWHFWARVWRTRILGELSIHLFTWPVFRWEMRRGSRGITEQQLRETWEFVTPSMKRMVLDLYRATDPEVFAVWEDKLRRLLGRVPSLALWGREDPYIDPVWASRLGAGRVEILDGYGHWLPLEAPDEVASRLRELFLETSQD